MEPCDLLLSLINPCDAKFNIKDKLMHQVFSQIDDINCLATFKMCLNTLQPLIQTLSEQCEIVLYTFLPTKLMQQIINYCMPQMSNCISHILGYDELTFSDD